MTNLSEKKGGGLIYNPPRMLFDGSTGYYSQTVDINLSAGWTVVGQLRWDGGLITSAGGFNRGVIVVNGSPNVKCQISITNDESGDSRAGRLSLFVQDAAGATLATCYSTDAVSNGELVSFLLAYDPAAGAAVIKIGNNQDQINGSATGHTLISGTMTTGSGSCSIGARPTPDRYFDGLLWVALKAGYDTNWSAHFDQYGNPRYTDFSAWAYGHFAGKMDENEGTAGAMTKNGTITLVDPGVCPHIGLPTIGTAEAWDIKTSKIAWVDGVEKVGSGYFPAMMAFDGSSGYYSKTSLTFSGNKTTAIVEFSRASFTGDTFERLMWSDGAGGARLVLTIFSSNHSSFPNRRGKLQVDVQNTSATAICKLISSSTFLDGLRHTVFIEFDGDAGTAEFIVDGADEDDTGNADRVAPTTGTLATTSGQVFFGTDSGLGNHFGGSLGFCGYRDVGGLTWSDFMQTDGSPKQLDESTWTEWGAQPLFWHESGLMTENKGSAGAMTKNGNIVLAPASSWS